MITNEIIVILAAYFLGSIPSAYIVGRLLKGIDMREVGDGRIGTSFTIRRLGLASGITVAIMDFTKGVIAIILAEMFNVPLIIVLLCGVIVVVGHNWSIFLGFKGGKGAATTFGVLASLMLAPFLIALSIVAIPYFLTHRSTLATGIMFGILPILLWAESMLGILPMLPWVQDISPLLIIFPLFLSIPMFLKHPVTVRAESEEKTLMQSNNP